MPLTIFVVGLLPLCQPAAATDWSARFLREYPAAAERLEAFYTRLAVEIETTSPGEPRGNTGTVKFASDGASFRIERLAGDSEVVQVATPKGSFRLGKGRQHDRYAVTEIAGPASASQLESMRLFARWPFAPFCVLDQRIVDIMKNPTFQIVRAAPAEQDGASLVEIEWKFSVSTGERKVDWIGSWTFLPERGWALARYRMGAPGASGARHAAITYRDSADAIPVVERIDYWKELGGARSEEETVVARNLKLGAAAPAEFLPSAFGLPDDLNEAPAAQPRAGLFLWLVAGSAALLLLVGFMRMRRMRGRQ